LGPDGASIAIKFVRFELVYCPNNHNATVAAYMQYIHLLILCKKELMYVSAQKTGQYTGNETLCSGII